MRLWIGLHLPRLSLGVFTPSWSTDTGSVVLEHERVLVALQEALDAGVRTGMRRGRVLIDVLPATPCTEVVTAGFLWEMRVRYDPCYPLDTFAVAGEVFDEPRRDFS